MVDRRRVDLEPGFNVVNLEIIQKDSESQAKRDREEIDYLNKKLKEKSMKLKEFEKRQTQ